MQKSFLIVMMMMIAEVSGNARRDRTIRSLRRECQSNPPCSDIVQAERRVNCVNKCISEECYQKIFAGDPLEDGEVDTARSRQFTNCVRRTLHAFHHHQRKKRKESHHEAL